jgi:hypothetical protein
MFKYLYSQRLLPPTDRSRPVQEPKDIDPDDDTRPERKVQIEDEDLDSGDIGGWPIYPTLNHWQAIVEATGLRLCARCS